MYSIIEKKINNPALKNIEWTEVEKEDAEYLDVYSTHLYRIGYDHETKTLEIWFYPHSGKYGLQIYQYYGVNKTIWDRFAAIAGSKGEWFWRQIRSGGYVYSRIR